MTKQSDDKDIAISVRDLHKTFKLPHEQHSGLKQLLLNIFRRHKNKGFENQHVLKGVSFTINHGEFFGIVGRNGSGKSTLLKLMAGIYTPDTGEVSVHGSLTPFIELGVGFNPELTGRENVYLNGALLGFSRSDMEAMYDDIVDFAELERFMDQKLKNYSSGMQVRLAFSIAIRAKSDILLLDEVLAVGDAAFQQKCFDYFATVKAENKTVILVSHSMSSIERFCDRALLLEQGEVVSIGSSSDIAFKYENLFIDDTNKAMAKESKIAPASKGKTVGGFAVSVDVLQRGKEVGAVQAGVPIAVRLKIKSTQKQGNINVGINLRNAEDRIVFSADLRKTQPLLSFEANEQKALEFEIENHYTNGEYYIDIAIVNERSVADKVLYKEKNLALFKVMGIREHIHSLFHPHYTVKAIEKNGNK